MSGTNKRGRALLRALNIFGLSHLDPVILAALADERPLLLIGPPGTAKSELLNRIGAALKLEHRHYNASLISFDDLLGYPVPTGARDGIEYLHTPGDLWEAESVFLDEISRCRPEVQNKLFSIIHEKRVQGLPLERLRYRWSAMNPPPDPDAGDADDLEECLGSLPLDPALADRFPWVVALPPFDSFAARARRELLCRGGVAPKGDQGLPSLVAEAKVNLGQAPGALREWAAAWVDALVVPLREARLILSGRRAVSLVQSVLSLWAAAQALEREEPVEDLAFLALKWGLPQRALGCQIEEAVLAQIHRQAVADAGRPEQGPWRTLREEADPVRRLALALGYDSETIGPIELSQFALDVWASLETPERYAFSWAIAPVLASCDRFTAPACEQLAEPMGKVLSFTLAGESVVQVPRNRAREWDQALAVITKLRRKRNPHAEEPGNLLSTLFGSERCPFEAQKLVALALSWRELFEQAVEQAPEAVPA